MAWHVGLTGGIGSGKSTLAKAFEQEGIPVFYADQQARELYKNPQFLANVQEIMPENICLADGSLDAPQLGKLIFAVPELKLKLEHLVHPAVAERYADWTKLFPKAPFFIREAAILYESGTHTHCQLVIAVTAPQEVRIQRVMQRNGLTETQVLQRMNSQWPEQLKMERADLCWHHLELSQYPEAAQCSIAWIHHRMLHWNPS